MKVFLDNFKEYEMRQGNKFLVFNVAFINEDASGSNADAEPGGIVYTLGWRLIEGAVFPPSSKVKPQTYKEVTFLSRDQALGLYAALEALAPRLTMMFPDSFKLNQIDEALDKAVLRAGDVRRHFPNA